MTFKSTINIKTPAAKIGRGGVRGVELSMEHLLTEGNKIVPHDEGTLERSGATGVAEVPGAVLGSWSYDTPYAVKQHEDLSLHHHGKGQAKWAENTQAAESGKVGKIIGNAIRQAVGT